MIRRMCPWLSARPPGTEKASLRGRDALLCERTGNSTPGPRGLPSRIRRKALLPTQPASCYAHDSKGNPPRPLEEAPASPGVTPRAPHTPDSTLGRDLTGCVSAGQAGPREAGGREPGTALSNYRIRCGLEIKHCLYLQSRLRPHRHRVISGGSPHGSLPVITLQSGAGSSSHYGRGIRPRVRLRRVLVVLSVLGDPQCPPFRGPRGLPAGEGTPFPAPPSWGMGPCTLRVTGSHAARGRRVLRAGHLATCSFCARPLPPFPTCDTGRFSGQNALEPEGRLQHPAESESQGTGVRPWVPLGLSWRQVQARAGDGARVQGGASGEATGEARGGCGVTMPWWALSPWHLLGSGALQPWGSIPEGRS